MADVRENIQKEAKEAWLNSNRKNTIVAATGSGKSKIALDIIKELNPSSILLLTNAVNLRDTNWKNEFEKFGMLEYWNRVTSMTYQAAYNWINLPVSAYPLMILDEIDFACTPQYSRSFEIPAECVLGLTGFITEDKKGFLSMYYPICYEVSAQQMQEDELLNKSEFIFIEFPLSNERNIPKKTKTGVQFFTSENKEYEYWDKEYQKALIVKSTIEKKIKLNPEFVRFEDDKEWQKADWNFKLKATRRKAVLHNLSSSVKVVNTLLEHIHSKPDNKVVIFSVLTNQADKFPNPFHTKRQVGSIEALNEGRINTLSVIRKITRGVNLVGVNYFIRESYDGSEEQFHQTHGRALRLRPDQVAKYVILVPVYQSLVKCEDGIFRMKTLSTQAYNWVTKMMKSFEVKEPRIIRLDSDYKIKDGIEL